MAVIFSNNLSLMVAGAAGIAFLAYTIYFDHKRRSAPDYKESIRRSRKKKQEQLKKVRAGVLGAEFPDPRNPMSSQTFLFEQISIGETMMEGGRVEEAVIHLSNAAVASGQPAELLQIFQQTVPPEVFTQLVQAIPAAKSRQQNSLQKNFGLVNLEMKAESREPVDELDLE